MARRARREAPWPGVRARARVRARGRVRVRVSVSVRVRVRVRVSYGKRLGPGLAALDAAPVVLRIRARAHLGGQGAPGQRRRVVPGKAVSQQVGKQASKQNRKVSMSFSQ